MEAVVDGLITELKSRMHEVDAPFQTIYIGGGTPSTLPAPLLEKLVRAIPAGHCTEFTVEVNPENVDADSASLWRDLGINRISMGVQTLTDPVLKSIGRRHTGADALRAIDTLHGAGFDNVSADLIYGLPEVSQQDWEKDLRTVIGTGVTHMSAYCLSYYPGTMLYKMAQNGRVVPADDEQIAARFEALRRISADAGFEHYEISNLALPGYRSRHNSAYWNPGHTWLGIGPSAHSFDGRVRREDWPDTAKWLKELPAPFHIEDESELDLVNDNIVTALRTSDGLDLDSIPANLRPTLLRQAAKFVNSGAMTLSGNRIAIKPDHWLTSDYYIRELIIE